MKKTKIVSLVAKTRKHLLINIDGEDNIGVLQIDVKDFNVKNKKLESQMRLLAEAKLVKALEEHFNCQVKVIMSYVDSVVPIKIRVDVVICSDDNDYNEAVELDETWVY